MAVISSLIWCFILWPLANISLLLCFFEATMRKKRDMDDGTVAAYTCISRHVSRKKPWSEQFSKFIKCAITTKWRNISYDDFYARVTDALETLANWRKLVFHFHSRRAIADKVIDCFRPDYFWSGQIDLCYYWSHCESHRKVDRRRIIGNADSFTLCSAQNYDHLAVWQVNFITRANRQNTESFV